ncbi:hypothetical protein H696_03525 [Fonticula alba]|uniref:Uncharacterized protein n=1 Tax=Fonticula alba TaxID=691883 RepID=A0A058Z976_FONAL|nr:hypothetical protein H696_03525 [Fonticula alba]KCV70062.1 hypothetical protein H696_03525 [Fonticula alba]|eukprot:XP_009495668.1 hypothetical protein H696_03525 [Fonticula alba]
MSGLSTKLPAPLLRSMYRRWVRLAPQFSRTPYFRGISGIFLEAEAPLPGKRWTTLSYREMEYVTRAAFRLGGRAILRPSSVDEYILPKEGATEHTRVVLDILRAQCKLEEDTTAGWQLLLDRFAFLTGTTADVGRLELLFGLLPRQESDTPMKLLTHGLDLLERLEGMLQMDVRNLQWMVRAALRVQLFELEQQMAGGHEGHIQVLAGLMDLPQADSLSIRDRLTRDMEGLMESSGPEYRRLPVAYSRLLSALRISLDHAGIRREDLLEGNLNPKVVAAIEAACHAQFIRLVKICHQYHIVLPVTLRVSDFFPLFTDTSRDWSEGDLSPEELQQLERFFAEGSNLPVPDRYLELEIEYNDLLRGMGRSPESNLRDEIIRLEILEEMGTVLRAVDPEHPLLRARGIDGVPASDPETPYEFPPLDFLPDDHPLFQMTGTRDIDARHVLAFMLLSRDAAQSILQYYNEYPNQVTPYLIVFNVAVAGTQRQLYALDDVPAGQMPETPGPAPDIDAPGLGFRPDDMDDPTHLVTERKAIMKEALRRGLVKNDGLPPGAGQE